MARQKLKQEGYSDELIEQSTAHNETDDEVILKSPQKFNQLVDSYSEMTKEEHDRVVDAGGLYILGTERHESRRIDNQLRGRAGRQGDPGKSKFYLSLEDDLMRLFGGERMQNMFETLGVDEDMQIENRLLTNQIESAQRKVEGRNFGIRKNVLEYDDVMNQQREMIYNQRRQVLEGADLEEFYEKNIRELVEDIVATYCTPELEPEERDVPALLSSLIDHFGDLPVISEAKKADQDSFDPEEFIANVQDAAIKHYNKKEEEIGSEIMREAERVVLLKTVDQRWMAHIDAMDELRNTIGMRGYGQHNPVIEYQREGREMFEEMNQMIQEDSIRIMMRANFTTAAPPKRESQVKNMNEVKEEDSGTGVGRGLSRSMPDRPVSQVGRAPQQQTNTPQTQQPAKRDIKKSDVMTPVPVAAVKNINTATVATVKDIE